MGEIMKLCLFILGLIVTAFLTVCVIMTFQAPIFKLINGEVVMKYNDAYDKKLPSGYYQLKKVEIETRIKD